MRRIAVLLCGLACLAAPASASAVITPTTDAAAVAAALDGNTGAAGTFTETPPTGAATPHATADSTPLAGFPRQSEGDFAILTTGDASLADQQPGGDGDGVPLGSGPGHGFEGAPGNAYDSSILRLDLDVPVGQTCLSFEYRFFTEEFDENVGETVNDGFVAALDADFTTDENGDIADPTNFALDGDGELISVNTAALSPADPADGTTYDGATPILTASTPITAGAHSLYLAIFDQGDGELDSAVFVDNLSFSDLNASECGGRPDPDAPAVSITEPAAGATTDELPTFGGQAGAAATDSPNVTVQVYRQGSDTPIDVLSTVRDDAGAWFAGGSALAPGTYVARAHQTDTAGNLGVSASRTFTVEETVVEPTPIPEPTVQPPPPPPPPPAPPAPELGKSFVAGTVSGTIRIRLKNGRFRTLRANEEIPLGSTVDATKGRVRLTSAAGAGGATQTADFYRGQFLVTQTKGAKPITQLTLNAPLACGKGKASAAAKKKKVRSLWGDGKGRFRTRGRHGAATVRGTQWYTKDTCTTTTFKVKRGVVSIRDFVKRKTVTLKKGHSYVVRKKKRK